MRRQRKRAKMSLPRKKSKDESAKKKGSDEAKKKEEEEAAAKKKAEEAEAAKKDEAASGAKSRDAIKQRDAAFKKLPLPEQKELANKMIGFAKAGQKELVAKMIEEDGTTANCVDGDGWTPLMKAAEAGKVDTCELLLDYGADTSLAVKLGEWGNNALHHAARQNQTEVVKVLLARGKKADTAAKNFQGKTPR